MLNKMIAHHLVDWCRAQEYMVEGPRENHNHITLTVRVPGRWLVQLDCYKDRLILYCTIVPEPWDMYYIIVPEPGDMCSVWLYAAPDFPESVQAMLLELSRKSWENRTDAAT